MSRRQFVRKKRRDYKRRALKVKVPSKPLLAWKNSDDEDLKFSFEPSLGERVIYHNGELHEHCPSCGYKAGDHWGERKDEKGFYVARCPDTLTPGSPNMDLAIWNREGQNYIEDVPGLQDVFHSVVYGGVPRSELFATNQKWRETQEWYDNPNWSPCRKLGCKQVHDYQRFRGLV